MTGKQKKKVDQELRVKSQEKDWEPRKRLTWKQGPREDWPRGKKWEKIEVHEEAVIPTEGPGPRPHCVAPAWHKATFISQFVRVFLSAFFLP